MAQGAYVKKGKKYILKFYAPKWGQNAFYLGKENKEPKYTKDLDISKEYATRGNAVKIAGHLTELTGVKHSLGIVYR